MGARGKIRPEIGKEMFGFFQDDGTRNAIFVKRMLSERATDMQRNQYACFIDFTKAFDKAQYTELLNILAGLELQ